MFDALDGGFCESGAEVFDGHIEEVAEAVIKDGLAGVEGAFARCLSKAVPWTGVEAVIAAINAVTDGSAVLRGDAAFVLDGEVGDAAGGFHLSGASDGLGRAG